MQFLFRFEFAILDNICIIGANDKNDFVRITEFN